MQRFSAQRAAPVAVEKHFEEAIREVTQLEKKRPPTGNGRKKP